MIGTHESQVRRSHPSVLAKSSAQSTAQHLRSVDSKGAAGHFQMSKALLIQVHFSSSPRTLANKPAFFNPACDSVG